MGHKHSTESRQKMSDSKKNAPKKECPHCHKMIDPLNYSKHHGDRCKMKPLEYDSETDTMIVVRHS